MTRVHSCYVGADLVDFLGDREIEDGENIRAVVDGRTVVTVVRVRTYRNARGTRQNVQPYNQREAFVLVDGRAVWLRTMEVLAERVAGLVALRGAA